MLTQAEVIVREGTRALGRYFLNQGEYVIGRDMSCDIFFDGTGISRRHAQIIVASERLLVRDLDSTNGTFVGDNPVQGDIELPPGNSIRLGTEGSVEIRLVEEQQALHANGNGHHSETAAADEALMKALTDTKAEQEQSRKKEQ